MLVPTSPGTLTLDKPGHAHIDYSNAATDGYVTASCAGEADEKCQLQVSKDGNRQSFTLEAAPRVMTLCYGDGSYSLRVVKQIKGSVGQTLLALPIEVRLRDPMLPWLYPNTYSWFTPASECVKIADDICRDAADDVEKFAMLYYWILAKIEYDGELAQRVQAEGMSWFLPDPDSVLAKGKGICWEYASLTAAMCRSQGIPCKICIGRVQGAMHAWNEIYLVNGGEVNGIEYMAGAFSRADLTFMDSSNGSLAAWVMDDNNYAKVEYYG